MSLARKYYNSPKEAEFHKRVKGLLTRRQQGYVMQAWREVEMQFAERDKQPNGQFPWEAAPPVKPFVFHKWQSDTGGPCDDNVLRCADCGVYKGSPAGDAACAHSKRDQS